MSANTLGANVGIAQMPGFRESLRLLVERERYSFTDIGMMFDVSRERVRQLCERYGIVHPDTATGMMAERVWDDTRHCFQPVKRGEVTKSRRRLHATRREQQRNANREERQRWIIETVNALTARLQREPSYYEMWRAIGGRYLPGTNRASAAVSLFLSYWDARSGVTMRERLRDFRRRSGRPGRSPGHPGHLPVVERPSRRRSPPPRGERCGD